MTSQLYIVIGTKAQLIKMAPIMRELDQRSIKYTFIFTGQHQASIQGLLQLFELKSPDIILTTGSDVATLWQVPIWLWLSSWRLFQYLRQQKKLGKKQLLLVHGDTFSTLLGALVGRLLNIPVSHVEAGLRSGHLLNPFPEELIRRLVTQLSNTAFCPGEWSVQNLRGFSGSVIDTQSNTLIDTLDYVLQQKPSRQLQIPVKPYIVCSIHRFENIFSRKRFREILRIIFQAARAYQVLFILHPPTKKQLVRYGWWILLHQHPKITLLPRLSQSDFLAFVRESDLVISDGGSNQEECAYLGQPCLLLRQTTERPEGLEENIVLSRFDPTIISQTLSNPDQLRRPPQTTKHSPTKIIVDYLEKQLS
jgi:UDP-N-acetylglucosamine 2-epimerase (non-hydrolysing)